MSQPKLPIQSSENRSTFSSLDAEEKQTQRTLIICIDRDDDIGVKAGVKTPVAGRDACVRAATQLALSDPEEADSNTIFAAIKEYDDLLSKGEICEVVVVSGVFERGVVADRKIRSQVVDILKVFPADGAVLVSDGIESQELVPVLQSLVPIVALRDVVIKHSKSVEESYEVLGRYFRMLLFDSRYSRYTLGVPGIIFVAVVLIYQKYPQSAVLALTVFIGAVFIIRGFDIDRKIESIRDLTASGYLRLFSVLASILIVLVGFASGIAVFFLQCNTNSPPAPCSVSYNASLNLTSFLFNTPKLIGYFIINGQLFIWLGLGVYVATSIVFSLLRVKSRHIARYAVELSVLALLYFPVSIFANTLVSPRGNTDLFVAIIMFALAINFTIAAYLYRYINNRRRQANMTET